MVRNRFFFQMLTGLSDTDTFKTVILLGIVIQLHICSILILKVIKALFKATDMSKCPG